MTEILSHSIVTILGCGVIAVALGSCLLLLAVIMSWAEHKIGFIPSLIFLFFCMGAFLRAITIYLPLLTR